MITEAGRLAVRGKRTAVLTLILWAGLGHLLHVWVKQAREAARLLTSKFLCQTCHYSCGSSRKHSAFSNHHLTVLPTNCQLRFLQFCFLLLVCLFVCVRAHVCVSAYIYCMCMYACVCACVHMPVCVCVCGCVHRPVCVCAWTRMCACMCASVYSAVLHLPSFYFKKHAATDQLTDIICTSTIYRHGKFLTGDVFLTKIFLQDAAG